MRNLVKDEAIPVTEYEKCVETGKITNPLIEAKKCNFRCLDDTRVQNRRSTHFFKFYSAH